MSLPKLLQKTVSAVFNSPLLQALGLGDVYQVLNDHFVLSAQEMTQTYQNSYAYALSAIAVGLASEESWQKFLHQITQSQVEKELSSQVVTLYLEPFAKKQGLQEANLEEFRQQAVQACQALVAEKEALFQIGQFQLTEAELATLVDDSATATLSELVLAHLQMVASTQALLNNEALAQFLVYNDLLGHALLFFLTEALRDNKRFKATMDNLRQQGLLTEIRNLQQAQSELKAFFSQKLTAIEQQLLAQNRRLIEASPEEFLSLQQQSKNLLSQQQVLQANLAQVPQRLEQLQKHWETTQTAFVQFSEQFQDWTTFAGQKLEMIVSALPDLRYDIKQLDGKVEEVLAGQAELSAGQQRLLDEIRKIAARLEISAQLKPQDEFTQYSGATAVKLRQAIAQFQKLPNYVAHSQATLQVGNLSSVLGDFKTAERLFIEIYQNSQNKAYKARACSNLFHLYLRNGSAFYDKALKALREATRLDWENYALHNEYRYPIKRILGVGGMGCVFLCHNPIEERRLQQDSWVVVKCLWQTHGGSVEEVFAEPLDMAEVAGEFVPKPLEYGYVDIAKRERAYFVTEFIEGAIDGEAWLAKHGKMDFTTGIPVAIQLAQGLQKAHVRGIFHLDLKPANLLLKPSNTGVHLKIIDFGLARIATSLRQHAAATQIRTAQSQLAQNIFGTFDYAPPEQWGDIEYRLVTAKSDIFALGKTLYRLFTGKRPQHNIRQKYLPNVPELHELIEDCVEPNPADRPDIASVLTHLQEIQELAKSTKSSKSSKSVQSTKPKQSITQTQTQTQKPTPAPKTFAFEIVTVNAKGEITHRENKQARYETEDLGNGVLLEMVPIPSGTFLMGSPKGEGYDDEKPQHRVTVESFWMGKYPITQAQWQVVMGKNPSRFKGDNRPVETVSWQDAVEFCQRLFEKTGKEYRLPSEAEWEYACRAGTTTPFYFGETITGDLVNYDSNYTYASEPEGVYRSETTEVATFPANAFGLYDMHGNVWEWCADIFHENYNDAPVDGSAWLEEKLEKWTLASLFSKKYTKSTRLLRGGSWNGNPFNCRAAIRVGNTSDSRVDSRGFRVVVVAVDFLAL